MLSSPLHIPAKGQLQVQSARESAKANKWTSALIAYDQALATDADWRENVDFIHDRAIALFHNGQVFEALVELDKAVELQPDYGYRYAARGWMKQALKDYTGAISDYQRALELDPEDAISHNSLGLLEEQLGYHKEAKERFAVADELGGILENKSISTTGEVPSAPHFPTQETENEPEPKPKSTWQEIKRALGNPDGRKEFLNFIRNGFKLNR